MCSFGGVTKSIYDRDASDDDSLQSETSATGTHILRRPRLSLRNDQSDANRLPHKNSPDDKNLNDSFSTVS